MATPLLSKESKIIKWKFPDEIKDLDAVIFHIKIKTNRDRIRESMLKANQLFENENDFALSTYGNIVKIENVEGKELTEQNEIIDFVLDRLSENQGASIQLAIQGIKDWLERGKIEKN